MEFLKLMEGWEGYAPVNARRFNEAAIAQAVDLLRNKAGMPSHRWEYQLKEAITTSDFPELFGQVLDRQMLAGYQAWVPDWAQYCKVGTLKDFRVNNRHKVFGNDTLLPLVGEKGEYLVAPMGDGKYTIQLAKRGRQFDISWESLINDAMNAFGDIPARFSNAAIRTEAWAVTSLFAMSTGPHTSLFGAPIVDVDGANVTNSGALTLTIANLETTLLLMSQQTDANGQPISVRGVHLVVPPALEMTARGILTSAVYQQTASAVPVPTVNILPQMGLKLQVNPYLPIVDTSANKNTTWYVFAEPSEGAAIEYARLLGHESPEICMKASDKASVGGGVISPFDGDFATDNIFYRVRIVGGGTQLDPRFAYAQDGSGGGT